MGRDFNVIDQSLQSKLRTHYLPRVSGTICHAPVQPSGYYVLTLSESPNLSRKLCQKVSAIDTQGDSVLYQLEVQLIPQYNRIFLSNGRDPRDPRLMELARRMGATPVEIWEDREYWGETNAMLYLRDRFADDGFRCLLSSRTR